MNVGLFLFFKVTDPSELWGWLRREFLPNIYNRAWYNGLKDEADVYIANKMSIMIGMPSMRQLRIKKSKTQNIIFFLLQSTALSQRKLFRYSHSRKVSLKVVLK